jgi:eukaryotic-like serine/threonine-protein kinase
MSSQSPCPEAQHLPALARGTVAEPTARILKRHLSRCDQCLALFKELSGSPSGTQRLSVSRKRSVPTDDSLTNPANLGYSVGLAESPPATEAEEMPSDPETFPFLRPPAASDEIGRLGDYRVRRVLGRGGMSVVFQAEDMALQRPVALKVVKPNLHADYKPWPRFLREARILAAIKHQHVVMVYQAGQEGDVVYLALELLEGQTLGDRLASEQPLAVSEIVRLGRELAEGLAVIHRHGLIHRDVKPANVWLEKRADEANADAPEGRIKILDFGLARLLQDDSHLTQTGMVVGTPAYMSPEQARGKNVDHRSDLFSLGCVLYALCTGREPFRGANTMARLTALAVDEAKPVTDLNPALPEELSILVMQMLAKSPKERPDSANEVIARLRAIEKSLTNPTPVADSPPSTRRLSRTDRPTKRRKKNTRERSWRWPLVLMSCLLCCGVLTLLVTASALMWRWAGTPGATQGSPSRAYLSDEKPIATLDWPPMGPPGLPPPPNPFVVLSVNGKTLPHGLGMHASGRGTASISYSLRKQYGDFSTEVSLNDTAPQSPVPLTFSVFGDGRLLWRSSPVTTRADTQSCQVSVKDVDVLELKVTNSPGDPRSVGGAHGVWTEPNVTKNR